MSMSCQVAIHSQNLGHRMKARQGVAGACFLTIYNTMGYGLELCMNTIACLAPA